MIQGQIMNSLGTLGKDTDLGVVIYGHPGQG